MYYRYNEKEALVNSAADKKKKIDQINHIVSDVRNIKKDIVVIEKRINNDFSVLNHSFEEYKNPIVNQINKIKQENKAYERELERYKGWILKMQFNLGGYLEEFDNTTFTNKLLQYASSPKIGKMGVNDMKSFDSRKSLSKPSRPFRNMDSPMRNSAIKDRSMSRQDALDFNKTTSPKVLDVFSKMREQLSTSFHMDAFGASTDSPSQ
jgi:hypothetical protein